MSIFRCGKCEDLFDSDTDGCFENPLDDCSSLCEQCSIECEDIEGERPETTEFLQFMADCEAINEDEEDNEPNDEYYENLMSFIHSA